MQNLTNNDLHFVVSRLPKDVRSLMTKYNNLMVAGGFIRSIITREKVSDIDIFGESKDMLEKAAREIALNRKGRIYETDNAVTVLSSPRHPLQFIHRWLYTNLVSLSDSFDYTVCQAVIAFRDNKWISVCSDMFYPDLAARRLNYTCPQRSEDVGGSMLRMRKFLSRGYTIQALSMAKVIARLVTSIDWKMVESCAENNEHEATQIITNLLREVDPLTIIDGVDFVDEHDISDNDTSKEINP